MKKYTKQVFRDEEGEYLIDIGGIADELGWTIGDTLVWIKNDDGSFTLRKFTSEK